MTTYILAFTAVLMQIGAGVLPVGHSCKCIPVVTVSDSCCDQRDECRSPVEQFCPCGGECCIRVPTPDCLSTLSPQSQSKVGQKTWTQAAALFGAPVMVPTRVRYSVGIAPRTTESPPHLGAMRTTRLVI